MRRAVFYPGYRKVSFIDEGYVKRTSIRSFEASPEETMVKEGDYVNVFVKNTNTTISQMIKSVLYSITNDQSYVISAQASGAVVSTGY